MTNSPQSDFFFIRNAFSQLLTADFCSTLFLTYATPRIAMNYYFEKWDSIYKDCECTLGNVA